MDEKKLSKNIEMPVSSLGQLRKLTNKLVEFNDETQISLELVLSALFPLVWDNIKAFGSDCYTQGYLKGLEEGKENEN